MYACIAQPYAQSLQPTLLGEMRGKEIAPYCILSHPVSLSLTFTVGNHSLTASTPTKVKMNALTTCGGSRARERERMWERKNERREGKDMATVQGGKSGKRDCMAANPWQKYITEKVKSCNFVIICWQLLAWYSFVRHFIHKSCFTIADINTKPQIPKVLSLFRSRVGACEIRMQLNVSLLARYVYACLWVCGLARPTDS